MASPRETWKGLASEQSLTELTSALEVSAGTFKRVSVDFTRPADTTNYTAGDLIAPAVAKVKQVSTVTLTGAGGLATITGTGGLTSTVTFNTTLGQTAIDFVATYDTPYDELDVPVTITAVGDNVAYINLIGDADFRNACPYIDITFDALLANSTVVIGKVHPDVEYVCASDSGDMYVLLQSVDAVTTPASGASFKLALNIVKS